MPVDILPIIDTVGSLTGAGMLLLAVIRAAQIRSALVSQIFRRRAFWIVVVGVFLTIAILTENSLNNGPAFLFLLVLIVIIPAFIDRTILAAIDMDFFHRDTLRWKKFRLSSYSVPLVFVVFILTVILFGGANPPTWVSDAFFLFFAVLAVAYGYSVVTLIVGARRTQDRTMKIHVRFLAFALACFAIIVLNDLGPEFILINDFLGVATAYLIYRAVMSLSPTSRIEKEIA